MAVITIKFYALWRTYLGVDRLSLEADDMGQAMAQLEEKFGSRFRAKLQALGIPADGAIQDYCLLLLNGCNVSGQNLHQVKLRAEDVLHIFPLAAGG